MKKHAPDMETTEQLQQVIWKDIPGFEGYYQISNMGKVKSLARTIERGKAGKLHKAADRFLKPYLGVAGYERAALSKSAKPTRINVHRLVALAFIPNPDNLPIINHKNGIKTDNRVENLEWITHRGNVLHSIRVLGNGCGEKHGDVKLDWRKVREIRSRYSEGGITMLQLGENYGVDESNIGQVIRRATWIEPTDRIEPVAVPITQESEEELWREVFDHCAFEYTQRGLTELQDFLQSFTLTRKP